MTALHDLTLLEQAAAIRDRRVSPVELTAHALRRAHEPGDTLGAFVTVTEGAATAVATAAERRVMTEPADALPALLGVPTAVKDLALTAGVPTRFGTSAIPPVDLGVDEHVVRRLREAGLVSIGKTNTPEFGLPCYTEPDVAPPARTPWDPRCSAGGSSGGAGAAVAAGIVAAAHGSDGGGSIRIPASVCGLVGLKPSRGRVSSAPNGVEISGLSVHGPLARTVRDAAALLDAMAGPAPGDWSWAPAPATTFLAACDAVPARLTIGATRVPLVDGAVVHPDCVAAYDAAIALLGSLGHTVVEHVPAFTADAIPAFETVWAMEAAAAPIPADAEAGLRPLTRWLRERGRRLSGQEQYAALATLRRLTRAELTATAGFDAVLTPTLALPPVAVGGLRDDADPAADFEAQKRFTPFTSPVNITGQPAISLPLHWTDAGIPIGVQLIGRPYAETTLLALAAQLETARPWAQRRPAQW